MFSPKVREKLKFYVYLYTDPRTGKPFYIGKGQGNRCFAHLKDIAHTDKTQAIRELNKLGLKPRIEILKYGLTEKQALLVEATAIDLLDVMVLSNRVRGHGSRYGGRAEVDEIAAIPEAIKDLHEEVSIRSRPESLWDNGIVLTLLITLLCVEWALRKWNRLL